MQYGVQFHPPPGRERRRVLRGRLCTHGPSAEGRPFVKMKESNKPSIFLSDKYCVIVLLLNCLVSSLYLLRVHVVAKVAADANVGRCHRSDQNSHSETLRRFAVILLSAEPPCGAIDQPHIGCRHASETCSLNPLIAVLEDSALVGRHTQTPSRL